MTKRTVLTLTRLLLTVSFHNELDHPGFVVAVPEIVVGYEDASLRTRIEL